MTNNRMLYYPSICQHIPLAELYTRVPLQSMVYNDLNTRHDICLFSCVRWGEGVTLTHY